MDEQRCTHFFPWPTLCELAQPNASSTSLKSSVLKLHLGNWWSKVLLLIIMIIIIIITIINSRYLKRRVLSAKHAQLVLLYKIIELIVSNKMKKLS